MKKGGMKRRREKHNIKDAKAQNYKKEKKM